MVKVSNFVQVILSQINTSAAEYFFILHNILVSNMFVWGGVGEKKLKRGEWGGKRSSQNCHKFTCGDQRTYCWGFRLVTNLICFITWLLRKSGQVEENCYGLVE